MIINLEINKKASIIPPHKAELVHTSLKDILDFFFHSHSNGGLKAESKRTNIVDMRRRGKNSRIALWSLVKALKHFKSVQHRSRVGQYERKTLLMMVSQYTYIECSQPPVGGKLKLHSRVKCPMPLRLQSPPYR